MSKSSCEALRCGRSATSANALRTLAEQIQAFRACRAAQVHIQRGQRQSPALRQFLVGSVVDRQLVPLGQAKRGIPGMPVRFRIDADRQERQVGQGRIAAVVSSL
jgi:hypothetical protein